MVKDWDNLQQYENHNPNSTGEVYYDDDDAHSKNSRGKRGGGSGGGGSSGPRRRFYPSNVQGKFIVNAITGVAYPWRVGSIYEDLLWKVCDASAKRGKYEPDFYFYDSPKQAISHRRYKADVYSAETLDWWKGKVAKMTKLLESEDD
jgi:hypothetical protein